ncbi:ABC transporter ATP-binding protein [Butyricimonas sp. Marseille-P3923]|uniref:ABC transporter ATP-binding protein n=1 Tax=Butyricimonas sp. Marseille-P3923 TaxID=1987504 RepID=UPI000C07FCC9|nr:ABC transporter ATP-binding protein [Butyricimonas sp. Marseille-P3923]
MKIRIEHLGKIYAGGKEALRDLNLEIESGMFGLLGPNGAGKTTLMRIMTLLQNPTSGTIFFDDYDLSKDRKAIRSMLGYLPQDFRTFQKFRAWEFLDYSAGLAGIEKKKRGELVDEMLRKVGLYEERDRWANRLSGGMKRRLGIAQAIIGNPKIIIVDELTTGLDPEERIRFRNILSDISDKDATIILSTHIVGDISSSCKNVALLNHGQLKFMGTPGEMLRQARGKVWELFVMQDEYEAIKGKYPVIMTVPEDGGLRIQIVAEEVAEYADVKSIEPNLEHAYVYYMDFVLKDKMDMQAKRL